MAKEIGINKATISAFENDHQKATSIENLGKYTKRLGGSVEGLILLGREYDPCNAFVLKKNDPEKSSGNYEMIDQIEGLPARKHETKDWFNSVRLRMADFDVIPISPPINFQKDFFIARFILPPKRQIRNLATGLDCPVIGVISSGFDLRLGYADQSFDLNGIHSFRLNGLYPHSIINDSDEKTAVFYLVTKFLSGNLSISKYSRIQAKLIRSIYQRLWIISASTFLRFLIRQSHSDDSQL